MTTSTDALSQAGFDLLRESLESSFQELAKAHEAQLQRAVEAWQAATKADAENKPQLEAIAVGARRLGDVLEALMWVRYPAGSLDWFGSDERR